VVKRAIKPSMNRHKDQKTPNIIMAQVFCSLVLIDRGPTRPLTRNPLHGPGNRRLSGRFSHPSILTTHFVSCRFAVGLRSLGPIVSRPKTSRLIVPGAFRKTVSRMWSVGFMSGTMN
jgi:hypothetical protein